MRRSLVKKGMMAGMLMVVCVGCSLRSDLETRFAMKAVPEQICRVAVLPFENRTSNPEAGTMAYRIFYSELASSGALQLETEGEMRFFMLRNRLLPGQLLNASHYADLVERLEVDAVITGMVSEVGMDSRKAGENVPFVAMQLDMYDVRNGRRVLSTFHRRWGDDYRKAMHFGMVNTVTGVMSHLSREVIDDWIEKGVGDCR